MKRVTFLPFLLVVVVAFSSVSSVLAQATATPTNTPIVGSTSLSTRTPTATRTPTNSPTASLTPTFSSCQHLVNPLLATDGSYWEIFAPVSTSVTWSASAAGYSGVFVVDDSNADQTRPHVRQDLYLQAGSYSFQAVGSSGLSLQAVGDGFNEFTNYSASLSFSVPSPMTVTVYVLFGASSQHTGVYYLDSASLTSSCPSSTSTPSVTPTAGVVDSSVGCPYGAPASDRLLHPEWLAACGVCLRGTQVIHQSYFSTNPAFSISPIPTLVPTSTPTFTPSRTPTITPTPTDWDAPATSTPTPTATNNWTATPTPRPTTNVMVWNMCREYVYVALDDEDDYTVSIVGGGLSEPECFDWLQGWDFVVGSQTITVPSVTVCIRYWTFPIIHFYGLVIDSSLPVLILLLIILGFILAL